MKNPNWLCRLGFHDWSYYGELAVVTWKEPVYGSGRLVGRVRKQIPMHTRGEKVFTKRRCVRCGIGMKRIIVKNADGTLFSVGWEPLSESEYEKDEYQPRKREIRKRRMIR